MGSPSQNFEAEVREAVAAATRVCPTITATLADRYLADASTLSEIRADLFERITSSEVMKADMQARVGRMAGDDDAAGPDAPQDGAAAMKADMRRRLTEAGDA